jgi:hypothetical protein
MVRIQGSAIADPVCLHETFRLLPNPMNMRKCVLVMTLVMTALLSRGDSRVPVVVELFTSEGCSSCPPADALLAELSAKQPVPGAEIIVLGAHVDYWNYIGWTDRFSSPQWTRRQQAYVRRMRLDSAYTPQFVIDGRIQLVGGESRTAVAAISGSAKQPKPIEVGLSIAGDKLSVKIQSSEPIEGEVLLALTENNLTTQVRAGENGGRTLQHTAVLRSLLPLGVMRGQAFTSTKEMRIAHDWNRKELRAVVFVQQKDQGPILGARSIAIGQ